MEKKIKGLFENLEEKETLTLIRTQVEATSSEVKVKRKGESRTEVRRGKSQYVIDEIHKVVGEGHLGCNNAEGPCLKALLEHYLTQKIARGVIDSLHVLIPALYFNISVQGQMYSKMSLVIQKKFPALAEYAKEKLRLPKEARLLQQTNYTQKVAKANANLRELTDTKVLEVISNLRNKKDYISQICLAGLCSGSRISEICLVSKYAPAENPHYIQVTGVSKERQGDEKRQFVKPLILVLNTEFIEIIQDLRRQLEDKYGGELTRVKMTSLVDAKANKRIRELFGEGYVFHEMRAIYAQLAFVQYGPTGMSQTSFYSQVLGHKENSLGTALSYQTFVIRRKIKEDDPDLVTKITTLEEEFKALRDKEEKKKPSSDDIVLEGKQGIQLTLKKQPRVREGPEKKLLRLKTVVQEMEKAGVKPTYRNLSKLGFGTRVISAFFKEPIKTV